MDKAIILKLTTHQKQLEKHFFSSLWDTYAVKNKTMSGDTARAFVKKKCYNKYTPTSIFKHWVHYRFFESPQVQKELFSEMDFAKMHTSAIESLQQFWFEKEEHVKKTMPFYLFAKLIDLLFKSITRWEGLSEERREWYFNQVNVPLDKYSLLAFRDFAPKSIITQLGIPPNPSMGNVKSQDHYEAIQRAIKALIGPFPPLLFDLYAWDYIRPKLKSKEENYELIDA